MTTRENSLPIGTKLAQYKITAILGQGGFGITYLAEDTTLKHKVAIKEYFPTEMGIRDQDSITLHSVSNRKDDFQFGLEKFLEEGRTLVQFKHPNIVRVSNFLKLNNTAYLIMDFEEGEDLGEYLKRTNFTGNMPEIELKSYLVPILKGLQAVHDKGLLHRDVKPGNIYLRKNTEPMLIDFGAARYALGEHSKSMSAIISMGYAPPEQYSSRGKQNQATDLYAWAATAYQLIIGKPPVESPDRSNAHFEGDPDPLTPISQTHSGQYSKELLSTIDACLQLPNKTRPQSATQVMAILKGQKAPIDKTEIVKPEERFANTNKATYSNTGTKYVKDNERFANTKPKNNRHSEGAPRLKESPESNYQSKQNPANKAPILKYALILLVLSGISAGSYYGYNYYQQEQQKAQLTQLAAEAERQRLAKIAANKARVGKPYQDCSDCPTMVVIPSGSFQMGSKDGYGDEKLVHRVTIKQFSMSQTEVTFNQWDACYNAGGCSHKPKDEGWGRGTRPVINVSWNDAQEYIKWLSNKTGKSYRLPSEAEWEYAARAGSSAKYSWGNSISCSQARYGQWSTNPCGTERKTVTVKSYAKNSFGLYDMHGNVWEWVEDKYHDTYNGSPKDGSAWTSGSSPYRVLRGGSWYSVAGYLRSATRSWLNATVRIDTFGFRLAQDQK